MSHFHFSFRRGLVSVGVQVTPHQVRGRARIIPRIGRVSACGGVAWKGNTRCRHGRIADISYKGRDYYYY